MRTRRHVELFALCIKLLLCLAKDAGVTPALRRRRERAERQRSFMKEQQESVALLRNNMQNSDDYGENGNGRFASFKSVHFNY